MNLSLKSGSSLSGKTVNVAVSNLGSSSSQSVVSWGTPLNAAVSISLRRQQDVPAAPFAIYLDADVSGFVSQPPASLEEVDTQFLDIEYKWSIEKIGDPGWSNSVYSVLEKLPMANRVKGVKFGKRISHVFSKDDITGSSSTFRFTVTAVELDTGITATSESYDVEVLHPDAFWTAAETFVVKHPNSVAVDGWPATSNPINTNVYQASLDAAAAANAGLITRWRLVVEKGDRFITGLWDRTGANVTAIAVEGWGAGDKIDAFRDGVIWLDNGSNFADTLVSVQVSDFRRGGLDEGFNTRWRGNDCVFTIADSEFIDNRTLIAREAGIFDGYLLFSNVKLVSPVNAMVGGMDEGRAYSFIGTSMIHAQDVPSDEQGGGGYGLRPMTAQNLHISQCEIFIRQGWVNQAPGVVTTQPLLRLYTPGHTRPGDCVHVERNYLEGESALYEESSGPYIGNVVFDRNLHVGVHDTGFFLGGEYGMVVRNSHFVRPPSRPANRRPENNFNTEAFGLFRANGKAWGDRRPRIINNTTIDLSGGAAAQNFLLLGLGEIEGQTNGVLHCPNASTPVVFGSFSMQENAEPYYDGYDDTRGGRNNKWYQVLSSAGNATVFTQGDLVRGRTSGVVKTFDGIEPDVFKLSTAVGLLFLEDSFYHSRLDQAPGFERFIASEVLEAIDGSGNPTGPTVNLWSGGYIGTPFDSSKGLVALIYDTVTPTHSVTFSGAGGFEPGETITSVTGTATVCQVIGDILYLRYPTGTITSGQAITSASGSGTTTGDLASSGCGDLWIPTTNTTAYGVYSRWDLLGQERNTGNAIKGALVAS